MALRRWTGLLVALMVVGIGVPLALSSTGDHHANESSSVEAVSGLARNTSVPRRIPAEVVIATQQLAARLSGPRPRRLRIQRRGPIWMVDLWGRFVCDGCSHPVGAAAPSGTHAHLVVDPRYGESTSALLKR